jgi:serine/threonine protein kinase
MVNIDNQNLCNNCFSNWKEKATVCDICGYVEGEENPVPMVIPVGEILLGKYLIGKVLGKGGFGVTYLAYDLIRKVKVAIKEYMPYSLAYRAPDTAKVLTYNGEKSESFKIGLEKFYDEAKTIAKFNGHPNIINVQEFFYENNTAYFVMEYIDGVDLKKYITQKGGRLSEEEILKIVLPLMDSLMIVHSIGVLHRDISPDNIYIANDGTVKLLDFGAARQVLGEESKSLSVVLKPGFAPIEQYQTRGNQGAWTDVYSLAATMYYCLTGSIPEASMNRIYEDNLQPLYQQGIAVSSKFETAIVKALLVKPANRFQSMAEFKLALITTETFAHIQSPEIKHLNDQEKDLKIVSSQGINIKVNSEKRSEFTFIPFIRKNKVKVMSAALTVIVLFGIGAFALSSNKKSSIGSNSDIVENNLITNSENSPKYIPSVDFSFYYSDVLQQLTIDKTTTEGKTKLAALCTEAGYTDKTWKQYAFDLTVKAFTENQIQYDLAIAAKFKLTDADAKGVDDIFANLVKDKGGAEQADKFLVDTFGQNVTMKTLKPVIVKSTIASKYAEKAVADTAISDTAIQNEYKSNVDKYDTVTFRLAYFVLETKEGANDAETAKFDVDAKVAAEAFLVKATDEKTFKKLADEKTATDKKIADAKASAEGNTNSNAEKTQSAKIATMTSDEKKAYEAGIANQDTTIVYSIKKENLDGASADLGTWAFDKTRKLGDKKAFLSQGGYYAIYFVSREDKSTLPSARHILVSPNAAITPAAQGDIPKFSAAEWTAARTKAQDLLKQCVSLDKFKELVTKSSDDPGSKETGGLYEQIKRGSMQPEFNDWAFDSTRKVGDQGLVRTDYGFHIMRFEGMTTKTSAELNKDAIKTILAQTIYTERIEELKKDSKYKYKTPIEFI